ncbi:hypothetical protein UPYG_G00020540 [Umbra pygmaea]|uniref:C3H1-type domain-containing protein n=1 Tax=Umbra pygmaea TaxID=75934 RepID=A0ABD0XZ93_UMBPY
MGLKDHPLEDGAGRILDLGLDLEYLHIEGSHSRQAGADPGPSMEWGEEEVCANGSSSSTPREKEGEDSDPEPDPNSTLSHHSGGVLVLDPDGGVPIPKTANPHQPLCRTACVDLGSEGPPDPQPGEPLHEDPLRDYQTKLEFALKLGYSEELVRLVLSKLGPDTLINDILGELVKLGSKNQTNKQQAGCMAPQPNLSCEYVEVGEAQLGRSDSPCRSDLLQGDKDNLRPVVLDGSNVAMSHGNKEVFSCHGIQLAVDWFLERGHCDITVFVPAWRKEQSRPDALITDQEILRHLEKEKILVFTPSRRVQGRRVVCYDDRFIVKLAYESDGIIVSNDNYRDLANEKPEWKKFIDERLLMYSFVNDKFMPPDDPLGRHGPSLENFLRKRPIMPEQKKQPCPYGKKCTYGHKCKYYHPERSAQPQRSLADELRAGAKTSAGTKGLSEAGSGLVKSHSVPTNVATGTKRGCTPKRQSDPSIRALSYSEARDKQRNSDRQYNSLGSSASSSCSSSCGSVTLSPAPEGTPSCILSYPQEEPLSLGRDTHRMTAHAQPYPFPSGCQPPDLSYCSASQAYPGPSMAARRSPDCPFPLDMDLRQLGSGWWDRSSESSCDSYAERASCPGCPEPPLDMCSHRQHYQHNLLHHRQHSAPLPEPHLLHHAHSHAPSSAPHGYHQSLARGRSLPHNELPDPHPLYSLPHHLQHQADHTPVTQSGPTLPGSSLGRCLVTTRLETLSDSRLYERSPLPPRKAFSWDPYCHQDPPPRYQTYQSLPETPDVSWGHSWRQASHSYHPPRPFHAPQTPPPAVSPRHMHQEPSVLSRYGDVREKVYLNLCNIFPSELVGRVMGMNPHVTDAQELAAAILAEKTQAGY